MSLYPPSNEQTIIIKSISNNNIIVNAVAGSGKTTTSLHIANEYPQWNILLLTYNARLKTETRQRISKLGIKNMIAHNYHAFCRAYYTNECINETQMLACLTREPRKSFDFDLIICDEAQDITPTYYKLICKIIGDNPKGSAVRLLFVGDVRQSLYEYQGSDYRFLTKADIAFGDLSKQEWIRCELKTSYRVSPEICDFINNCITFEDVFDGDLQHASPEALSNTDINSNINSNSILAAKNIIISANKSTGIMPKYHIHDYSVSRMFNELLRILKLGYKPDDIFVLGQSVISRNKNKPTPLCRFENMVKSSKETHHIPLFAPSNDDEIIADKIMNGKLVFSTYHQAKGLERKVVFIIGFDEGQFRFYAKDENRNVCPNTIYVGMTRASHELIMFHSNIMPFYQFLEQKHLPKYAKVNKLKMKIEPEKDYIIKDTSVSQLLKHQNESTLRQCYSLLECEQIQAPDMAISIPHTVVLNRNNIELHEPVSDITGTMIPLAYEIKKTGNSGLLDEHLWRLTSHTPNAAKPKGRKKKITTNKITTNKITSNKSITTQINLTSSNLAYLTTFAMTEGNYIFKRTQIKDFGWVMESQLELAIERLDSLELGDGKFESKCFLDKKLDIKHNTGTLHGRIDFVSDTQLYEFKCVERLNESHYIQLALYMLMTCDKLREYYLYNILTDELIQVKCSVEKLKMIYEILLRKYNKEIKSGEFNPINMRYH